MLVANSFDLWQKDAFFSAAEEVQESADIMESAYRTLVRERRERPSLEYLDELSRELQTALGTAKWQLEEFERAVRLSHGRRGEDNSTARHSQFIAAIESQISRIEAALRESFLEQGKQPLRWINLDKEECDDLAAFLSRMPQITQSAKNEHVEVRPSMKSTGDESHFTRKDTEFQSSSSAKTNILDKMIFVKDEFPMDKNVKYTMELEGREILGSRDDIIIQADRTTNTRRTWSTPNFGALKIVITDEDGQKNKSMSGFVGTPKEKGSKLVFWKKRCGELYCTTGAVHLFSQIFGRVSGSQRPLHYPLRMLYGYSVQVTLDLMLTIFLIVPFLLYLN